MNCRGLADGVPAESQFARRLAENGCRVLVPTLISREMAKRAPPGMPGRANLTNREFVNRPAFELGQHIIGYELQKVLAGVLRACEKRPISMGKMEQLVNEVESYLIDSPERERTTAEVGQMIMEGLKGLDKVAYIRFASVYRDFKDVNEFRAELENLLNAKEHKPVKAKK